MLVSLITLHTVGCLNPGQEGDLQSSSLRHLRYLRQSRIHLDPAFLSVSRVSSRSRSVVHSNPGSHPRQKGPSIEVYAAPPSQIEFTPGGLEVCVDKHCEKLDAHQVYLNLDPRSGELN